MTERYSIGYSPTQQAYGIVDKLRPRLMAWFSTRREAERKLAELVEIHRRAAERN